MNQYSRVYQDILNILKSYGARVVHLSNVKKFGARIHHRQPPLVVARKEYKNTLWGCYALGHELGHLIDNYYKKYQNFFHNYGDRFISPFIIKQAEWSAVQFSKKLLKNYGLNTKNIRETHKNYFENVGMPYWLSYYNRLSVKEVEKCYEEAKKYQYRKTRNRRRFGRSCS